MTRTQRIEKLSNAIRAYRGVIHKIGKETKYKTAPDKYKIKAIERYAGELLLDIRATVAIIDSFKTSDEFNTWIRTI